MTAPHICVIVRLMSPKIPQNSEDTQLTTITDTVDLHLIERFNKGYFSGVTEAALAALAAYDQELAAVQASVEALESKKEKIREKKPQRDRGEARNEVWLGGHSSGFTSLRSGLASKEKGRDSLNICSDEHVLKYDPPRTLAEQLVKIIEMMDPEEVLKAVYFDAHKPTPEILDLYKTLVEAASELLNEKGELEMKALFGPTQTWKAVMKPLTGNPKFKRKIGVEVTDERHVSTKGELSWQVTSDSTAREFHSVEIDPNEIVLQNTEASIHFDELARDLFSTNLVESRERKIQLAKILAEWITRNHNPVVNNQLQILNELDKALLIKELELHEPAPEIAKEPWESDAFKAVLLEFKEGAAGVFKKEWLVAAVRALGEEKEPVWIEGASLTAEQLIRLQTQFGRAKKYREDSVLAINNTPAMLQWITRAIQSWNRPLAFVKDPLEQLKVLDPSFAASISKDVTVRPAIKQLYSAYEQALQIHQVGVQLCQLSDKEDTETHKRGMELLALGHALTFVLKRRSVGVAAQMAAGILNENATMADALLDLAELVHSNPTEDLNTILEEVGNRATAAMEVAGTGSASEHARNARKVRA